MTLAGMTNCDEDCQQVFVNQTISQTNDFFANSSISLVSNTPKITSVTTTTRLRRRLEDGSGGVSLTYDHEFIYSGSINGSDVKVSDLATAPFEDEADREAFAQGLKDNGGSIFDDLTGVTAVDILETPAPSLPPALAPTNTNGAIGGDNTAGSKWSSVFSTGTIIGLSVGLGLLAIIMVIALYVKNSPNRNRSTPAGTKPPDMLQMDEEKDSVSILSNDPKLEPSSNGSNRYVVIG